MTRLLQKVEKEFKILKEKRSWIPDKSCPRMH